MTKKPSAINAIWLGMILLSTVVAAYTGRMAETTAASFEGAKNAVTLAIGLVGVMALWLGVMKVAEAGGLMRLVARALRPLMVRLFPDVPPEHPAMSAMILNMAANALGLANAATPMGIKAMQALDTLNRRKGTASNAMCLFLGINTAHLALLPTGVMGVRASAGSANPAAILVPSILAALCAMATAVLTARWFARRHPDTEDDTLDGAPAAPVEAPPAPATESQPELLRPGRAGRITVATCLGLIACAVPFTLYRDWSAGTLGADQATITAATQWLIPLLLCGFLSFGYFRGVKVYEALTEGAKDGFQVAIHIIPYMAAIFTAIAMLRASGALGLLTTIVEPATSLVGMPSEALPMVFLRPLSGSGAFAFMSEVTQRDPDGFLSYLLAVMQGSTETTFYVLAVYFGAIGVNRTRHALTVGLIADAVGFAAALFFSRLFF